MARLLVDRSLLVSGISACVGKVKYRYGAKPSVHAVPGSPGFRVSDCSGFVRWMVYRMTWGRELWLPGSVKQREVCEVRFARCEYGACRWADAILRIGFMDKPDSHVWFVLNRQTIECYGGRGVGRRPWDTRVLKNGVDHCFELTAALV